MATSYGSITIVDIGDLGQLSVTPQSNQPTMVIYDPDNSAYNPNWAGNNSHLVLTPVVYYGGTKLLDSNTITMPAGLTVTWTKKIGSESAGAHGGTVGTTGKLEISSNPFDPSTATLITYIVTVTYTESNMGTTLTASGQITFGLIQNASKLKTVNITGPEAFLYNSSNTCQNSPIILTATVKGGITISKWQYKDSEADSGWSDINSTSSTLSINESTDSAYFQNDVAIIKVVTSDNTVYDEHTIVKIRDGANGTSLDSAVLSNEDQMVPCDKNGNPITGWNTECTTTLTIYEGNDATYTDWNIEVDQTHGVTGTWNATTHTFSAGGISANTGYVIFRCTKTGHNTLVKTFSLVKVKAGADGTTPTIYSLECNTLVINKNNSNTLTPSSIVVNAYQKTGNDARTSYDGIFKFYIGDNTSAAQISTEAESSATYTPPSNASKIRVELYEAGGSTLYDQQTVVITSDGTSGDPGPGGLNFILGNYSDIIPCTNGGLVAAQQKITIPFTVFQGSTRRACSATTSTLPSGVTLNTSQSSNGTASAAGKIVLDIIADATLGGAGTKTGTITITITDTGSNETGTATYTWTKNNQALDGASAVFFQLYAPDTGNVISNDANNVIIKPQLTEGTDDITISGSSYTWYYYDLQQQNYVSCSGVTGYTIGTRQLTIAPSAVSSYVSIKCTCSYNSNPYSAYFSVYDKTDPLQVTILSTLGDKIVNSVGKGILYTRVWRNGTEIDAIKTTNCGTNYPSSPTNGTYFWLLDDTAKTANLKKYNGSSWGDATSDQTGSYSWTRIEPVSGNTLTLADNTGKAIYLDASIVDSKTIFNVQATIN